MTITIDDDDDDADGDDDDDNDKGSFRNAHDGCSHVSTHMTAAQNIMIRILVGVVRYRSKYQVVIAHVHDLLLYCGRGAPTSQVYVSGYMKTKLKHPFEP